MELQESGQHIQTSMTEWEKSQMQNWMGIPKKYHNVLFNQLLGITDMVSYAQEMADRGHSITFTGPCGVGKTHLAICLMRRIWIKLFNADRDNLPAYKSYSDLLNNIKQAWTGNPQDEYRWINKLSTVPLLVLDDVGVGNHTDWSRSIIYQVVDKRYRDCRQTIITTNLSIAKFAEVVDDRIASRLCDGIAVEMSGKDWRVQKCEENLFP